MIQSEAVETIGFFLDGAWQTPNSSDLLEVHNPADGSLYARVAQARAIHATQAIDAAEAAAPAWANMLASQREALLVRSADVLERRGEELCAVLMNESGSSLPKAMFEIGYCVDLLRMAAGEVRHVTGETLPQTMPGQFGFTVRRPLGIIAGISPFNAPLLLAMKKVALALAAGNCFILKPSEVTPVIGLKIASVFEEAGLPPGVLNVLPGPAQEIGDVLLTDRRVSMLTFTGSTKVGQMLGVKCAQNQKKVTLELGGKNPLIILKDADIDYAVDAACFGIFFHQGQVCMASSRVIVEAPIYEQVCDKLARRAAGYKVGDPREPGVVVGPLIKGEHCDYIAGQVASAAQKGARILTGGTHDGRFFQPTVLADVDARMDIFHEETFGPVVSLIKAADAEDALEIANDSHYGLSSAIITNDLQKAMDLAMRVEAGMVHINSSTVSDEPHVPFGGIKSSGIGREGGRYSMEEMTELKWITIQQGKQAFPL
ncbi:MAG: aldehyde dehydrogenase family protein [Pseudomonadota bacterium]